MTENAQSTQRERDAPEDAPADKPAALPVGARIGDYGVVAVLGRGDFGITYQAHDTQAGRDVAIKEYLPAAVASRQSDSQVVPDASRAADFRRGRDRFLAEGKKLADLKGAPGIIDVLDVLEANDTAYLVASLVIGEPLEARLRRDRRLSRQAMERIMTSLLDGLERVHHAGFLHHDIEPAAILIDRTDQPTLVDFGGWRRAIRDRAAMADSAGSAHYAAPEQFTSAQEGPWTDIYSLGATFYHGITGAPPPDVRDRMQHDTMVPATRAAMGYYAPALLAAVDAALRLTEADRPQSIAEWRHMLLAPPQATTVRPSARRRGTGGRTDPWDRRPAPSNRSLWLAGGLIILSLVGGVVYLEERADAMSALKAAQEKAAAEAEAKRQAQEAAARKAQEVARAAATAWPEIRNSEDPARLRQFAERFAGTPEAQQALKRATELEATARRQAEAAAARRAAEAAKEKARAATAAWAELQSSEDPAKLRQFAEQYAGTPEARQALERAGQLEATAKRQAAEAAARRAAEAAKEKARAATAAWAELQNSEDQKQLRTFAEKYAGTPEARRALERADELRAASEQARRKPEKEGAPDSPPQPMSVADQAKAKVATALWAELRNSENQAELRAFAEQYAGTPEARLALNRADELMAAGNPTRRTSEKEGPSDTPPKDGPGNVTYDDGGRYVGDFANGERNGTGTYTYPNGDRYVGTWRNGNMHGRGVYTFADGGRYEGEWRDDEMNGRGVRTWPDGDRYDGDWRNGKKHGQGTYTFANGDSYVGSWVDDDMDGHGVYTWADGGRYDGEWRHDKKHGRGVRTWPDGDRYEGEWQNDRAHGQGTRKDADGDVFSGRWENGCFMEGNRAVSVGAPLKECER